MKSELIIVEHTGLVSQQGMLVFSFTKPTNQVSPPVDFKGWDGAQGMYTAGDAQLMVTLRVDPNDSLRATVDAQQASKRNAFETRHLHCPQGLALGSPVNVSFKSLPQALPVHYQVKRSAVT